MKQLYGIAIDDNNVVHQICKIENRIQALIIIKQLGSAITKISNDLLDDVERKGR